MDNILNKIIELDNTAKKRIMDIREKEENIETYISKEIEKQIKSKKISVNSKLITLFFLRNINNNKRENKALNLFFAQNHKQALLLSYIGANYGE